MSAMDVLRTTRPVVETARHVRLDADAVARWAASVAPESIGLPTQPHELLPRGDVAQTADVVLLIDALNFCFWAEPPWLVEFRGRWWGRYYGLVASVARAIEAEPRWREPAYWAEVGRDDVAAVFRGQAEIPLLDERAAIINETGRALCTAFGGRFVNLLESARFHAAAIAAELARSFPSFADRAEYDGRTVWILKRAQICAADVAMALEAAGGPRIGGLERLTAFADYRLPQILRHLGVMRPTPDLAARIDRGDEIPASSAEEVELRAATIWAVQAMHDALARRGVRKDPWLIDEYLWERSHDDDVCVPHHRTRTVFY